MLGILNGTRYTSNIITGDETYIYYDNPRKSMWCFKYDPAIKRKKDRFINKINDLCYLVIQWYEIDHLTSKWKNLPKKTFIDVVLKDLFEKITGKTNKIHFRTVLHLDNARPHLVKDELLNNGLRRMIYPSYSPDPLLVISFCSVI